MREFVNSYSGSFMGFLSSFAQDLMKEGEMKEEKKTEIPMMKVVTDDFEMEAEAEEMAA